MLHYMDSEKEKDDGIRTHFLPGIDFDPDEIEMDALERGLDRLRKLDAAKGNPETGKP